MWKKDHSRNWYVPCRVFRQREISEMLCVWRQYWRGAIYFKTGSVECDKSDNIPLITTSPSYLFSGSNNRDKVLIKDRQNELLHDPKTIRKKLISIDRVVQRCLLSCFKTNTPSICIILRFGKFGDIFILWISLSYHTTLAKFSKIPVDKGCMPCPSKTTFNLNDRDKNCNLIFKFENTLICKRKCHRKINVLCGEI